MGLRDSQSMHCGGVRRYRKPNFVIILERPSWDKGHSGLSRDWLDFFPAWKRAGSSRTHWGQEPRQGANRNWMYLSYKNLPMVRCCATTNRKRGPTTGWKWAPIWGRRSAKSAGVKLKMITAEWEVCVSMHGGGIRRTQVADSGASINTLQWLPLLFLFSGYGVGLDGRRRRESID